MLAFVHLQKTAGITINWILRRSFGLHHCDVEPWETAAHVFTAEDYLRLCRVHPRIDSIAGHYVRAYTDLATVRPDVRYYTFLREPLSRCASHYQYEVQFSGREISFDDWIAIPGYPDNQTRWLSGSDDLGPAIDILQKKMVFVGLVERFDESLVIFRRRVENPRLDISYRRKNTAPTNAIKNAIFNDSRMYAKLVDANRKDAQLYDFVRRDLYPRQQRDYGPTLERDVVGFRMSNDKCDLNLRLAMNYFNRKVVLPSVIMLHRRNVLRIKPRVIT